MVYKMKSVLRSVRGTSDLLTAELAKRRKIENKLRESVELFGYRDLETPILEHASLFERSLGVGSEVVSKEMFKLESRANAKDNSIAEESVVLRPENTASVLRALLNQGLQHSFPHYFYYCGPQFRYERPQKGRARQFHQFGVECYGKSSSWADAECILSAVHSLKELELLGGLRLKINTLGENEASRQNYISALLDYFKSWGEKHELSVETKQRIAEGRILRALDSKSPLDAECISKAPSLLDHLPQADLKRFNDVIGILKDDYCIPNLEIDPRLVRGLDYYSHTCFEFVTEDNLAVLAGGRYDGLARALGYDKFPVPAIGWAAGLERLVLVSENKKQDEHMNPVDGVYLMIVPRFEGDEAKDSKVRSEVVRLSLKTRREGYSCRVWYDEKSAPVKKALKEADLTNVKYVCFIGFNEVARGILPIRDVKQGSVKELDLNLPISSWGIDE